MDALFESAIRATFIAAATALVLRVMRVRGPAALHGVWSGVTVVMLLLPVVVVWIPKAAIPMPTVDTTSIRLLHQPEDTSGSLASPAADAKRPAGIRDSWQPLVVLYSAGVLICGVRIAFGLLQTRRLVRSAHSTNGRLTHPACVTPVTVGVMKPTIILPTTWQEWSPADRAAVLDHEQEHVRRHDPLMLLIALINRAVFWFHPLAWWLHRRIARLAEEACDTAVLSRGHDPRAYAESLLRFATRTAAARGRWDALGLQMPGRGVAARVSRILDNDRQLTPSRTRLAATAFLCSAAVAVCAAAAPTMSPRPQPPARQSIAGGPAFTQTQGQGWQVSSGAHFDLYYQRLPQSRVAEITRVAERAYERVSGDFKHDLAERVPLILITRQRDVPTNSIAADTLFTTTGAPPRADHILIGLDSFAEQSDRIVHELTHVFLFDIIPVASRSFPWLSEGLAEHERGAWNTRDLAEVRQAASAGRIPAVDTLRESDRQWGHAVSDFIGAEFGQDGIRRYLAALRRQPQLDAAAEMAFDISLAEFNRRFVAHVANILARR